MHCLLTKSSLALQAELPASQATGLHQSKGSLSPPAGQPAGSPLVSAAPSNGATELQLCAPHSQGLGGRHCQAAPHPQVPKPALEGWGMCFMPLFR